MGKANGAVVVAAVKQTRKNDRIGRGKPGPGRPKGSPNKVTAVLKEAIIEAATKAGGGDLAAYLERQARETPAAFLSLLGKILPLQVDAEVTTHYDIADEPLSEEDWIAEHVPDATN